MLKTGRETTLLFLINKFAIILFFFSFISLFSFSLLINCTRQSLNKKSCESQKSGAAMHPKVFTFHYARDFYLNSGFTMLPHVE